MSPKHPTTPDGRYFVVRGRLWRCSNPNLPQARRTELVCELSAARARVQASKVERGPAWWGSDPDYNRFLVKNTPYAEWWDGQAD